ncbi:MAG: Lrp/AsnC ligand binding domain-containing protein [Chitinispirillia bacterium]|nr:Lrp/AsnC ligand binding domain-containing protein [Chitinispirillia bacterium]MCL2241465.1 Lrp/AsnC ligand binding domain-containing protein [Chitinispirillia bacterium]
MLTAFVSLKVQRDKVNEIAAHLASITGVSEVYSIAGRFDLTAIIRVRDCDDLADIVTTKLLKIDGIIDSETQIAFRVHSKHDLESMFSLGGAEG